MSTTLPNGPASVAKAIKNTSPSVPASMTYLAASGSDKLLQEALENATRASLISQMATIVSEAMNSIANALSNSDSIESVVFLLKREVEMLAAISCLTFSLNKSVYEIMSAFEHDRLAKVKTVPPCMADSSDSTTSAAKSGQESSGGQSKSLPPKSLP
ncbi:unnamed protein product [Mesocestoides corti]|uniref:BLOC-1-related complex subunit 7 n=1 Tax=Mesocestoides corti TaxID=53468 RepID=A0A0R3UJM7_MESCO|nr:unnamed protein product [Mesocestoides corti]